VIVFFENESVMTMHNNFLVPLLYLSVLYGCLDDHSGVSELKTFPLDNLKGVVTQSAVAIDHAISSNGNGSLTVSVDKPTAIHLFEVHGLSVNNARLFYQAKVRLKNVSGQVYLEMWCHVPGKGEFFSRSLHAPLSGTTDWITVETPFLLRDNENPDYLKLNLVIDGTGTVWIDEMKLLKGAL
jgi:hypothetical protein